MEAKLNATRSEMDERIVSYEKKTKEYNDQLDQAHQKYRSVVAMHDGKTAELTRAHVAEIESLRRTSKEAEIECERLRTQIGQLYAQMEDKAKDTAKMVEDNKAQLAEAQQKFKHAGSEHESRVSDLTKKHAEQLDDLRRQLLAANLQCDKIRTELASHQMKAAPGDAEDIVYRTLRSASLMGEEPKTKNSSNFMPLLQILGAALVVSIAIGLQLGLTSLDALCSPAMPGTVLSKDCTMDAPWFAPGSEEAFSALCGNRPRTSLQWASGRLVVTDEVALKVLLQRQSTSAIVRGASIDFVDKKGKIESSRAPWSN